MKWADGQAALQAEHEEAIAALRQQADSAQAEAATSHANELKLRDDAHAAAAADAIKLHEEKHAQLLADLESVRADHASLVAQSHEHHGSLQSVKAKLEHTESELASATAKLSMDAKSGELLEQVRKDLQTAKQELADKTEVSSFSAWIGSNGD